MENCWRNGYKGLATTRVGRYLVPYLRMPLSCAETGKSTGERILMFEEARILEVVWPQHAIATMILQIEHRQSCSKKKTVYFPIRWQ